MICTIDFSDLGNAGLAISASVTVFVEALGYTKYGVIIGAAGLLWKGVCSAIDNYIYKKTAVAIDAQAKAEAKLISQ